MKVASFTVDCPICPECGYVMFGQLYETDPSKGIVRCSNPACDESGKRFTFKLPTVELTPVDD